MNPQNPTPPPEQPDQQPRSGAQEAQGYDWQQVAIPPSEQVTQQPQAPVYTPAPSENPQAPVPPAMADGFAQPAQSQPVYAEPLPQPQPLNQPLPSQEVYPSQPPVNSTPPISPPYVGSSYDDKRSPLPFIFGGIAIVVLLILGGVGAYFISTPSKDDYNKAIDVYNEVADANNSLSIDLITFTNPTGATTEQTLKEKYTKYEDAFAKLSGLKALNNQKVAEAYQKLKKKNDTSSKITQEIIDSFDELKTMSTACSSAEIETIQPCLDALKTLGESSKNDAIAQYAKDLSAEYDNFLNAYQALKAAASAGDGSAYADAYSRLSESSQVMSDLQTDFNAEADKMDEDMNLKKEADAFKDALGSEAKKAPF